MRHLLMLLSIFMVLLTACDTTERDAKRTEVAATGLGVYGERFDIQVTGDLEEQITPGFSQFFFAEEYGMLQMLLHDGGTSVFKVVLLIPADIEPGTHPITRNVSQIEDLDGVKATLIGPRYTTNFSVDVSGTLILDSVGERWSGSVSFSAANTSEQSVQVSGTFENVIRTDLSAR